MTASVRMPSQPKPGHSSSLGKSGSGLAAPPRTVGRRGDGLTQPSAVHWIPVWRKEWDSPQLFSVPLFLEPLSLAKGQPQAKSAVAWPDIVRSSSAQGGPGG